MRILANNKKAYFDFEILDKIEAGILLKGWEVKSVKAGWINLSGAYIKEKGGELFLTNTRIPKWKTANYVSKDEESIDRKLLLKKNEIRNLKLKANQNRSTIVPLEVYENDKGLVKVLIGLAKGKKKYDKRQKLKEKDIKRRIEMDRKEYNF